MIRQARIEDADAISQLWLQLVAYHRALDDAMPTASATGAARYARRLMDHMQDNRAHVFVAEKDDVIVGYVLGVVVDTLPDVFVAEYTGFLADIFVLPAYRGEGIGRKLVQALEEAFRSVRITHYEWFVAAKNQDGRAFWEAMKGRDVIIRMRTELD